MPGHELPETSKIPALWVAGFEAILPDGTVLVPNETVYDIGAAEARDSDHWRPQSAKKSAPEKRAELAPDFGSTPATGDDV